MTTSKSLTVITAAPRHRELTNVTPGKSLTVAAAPTWVAILAPIIDDDFDQLPIQFPEFAALTDAEYDDMLTDAVVDERLRALVTPDDWAQVSPEDRQAIERLARELRAAPDPMKKLMKDDSVGLRLSTLLTTVPKELVLQTAGEALRRDGRPSLNDARRSVHAGVLDFRDWSPVARLPAQPRFDADEFGRMAEHVLSRAPVQITAAGDRKFYADDEPIPTATINAFIEAILGACVIWDHWEDLVRGKRVSVSNRLVSEVRGSIARKRLRPPPRKEGQAAPNLLAAPSPLTASAEFASERLAIEASAWTASADIWAAWVEWCLARGSAPGGQGSLFKELARWGGGEVRPRRRRVGGALTRGYEGASIR